MEWAILEPKSWAVIYREGIIYAIGNQEGELKAFYYLPDEKGRLRRRKLRVWKWK